MIRPATKRKLTLAQAAKRLKVSAEALSDLVDENEHLIETHWGTGRPLYEVAELDRFAVVFAERIASLRLQPDVTGEETTTDVC